MRTILATLILLLVACAPRQSEVKPYPPLALHPGNPHCFLFRGKPTLLVTSGEHYGAVLNLDFDYNRYLDALAADSLNLTRTWAGAYREIPTSFGITENTLAPVSGRFICPWARSGEPGNFDGGNRFDLNRWDEAYFTRLKDFMAQASARGVVVELNLFCPNYNDSLWLANPMNKANNVNSVGDCPATEPYTLKHPDLLAVQEAVVRKIVAELKDCDNLFYEVCNEPYWGGVTLEWQHRIADIIADAEKDFPQRHLISMNIANGSERVADPHPAVSIFNFHYCRPPDAVRLNWDLGRVIGDNETGFLGSADSTYRVEGWDFILAGGALYNNLDYSFSASHPDGTLSGYISPGGGSPELRKQLGILARFMRSFDFVHMAPDSTVVAGGLPEGATVRVLSEPGKQYALYIHGGNSAPSLQLNLPAGKYSFEWLDTKTGLVTASGHVEHHGGTAVLGSPAYGTDIALGIKAE
ncbi:DUF6298 domain-containing protein [bacterium]|nr:DUF6298 domain-containing protein [bacterium]